MKAELINPIANSLVNVFKGVSGFDLERGSLFLRNNPIPLDSVAVIVGITGELRGQLVISVKIETALRIASAMMMGAPVTELDELSKSAISELGNMVAGNYATALFGLEYKVDITTPIVLSGDNMKISMYDKRQLSIPFNSGLGEITVDISISE